MADRTKKTSDLVEYVAPDSNTLFVVTKFESSGAANTVKLSVSNLLTNSTSDIVVSNTNVLSANTLINRNHDTPANSTITVTKGTQFYDDDYFYIAVANNTLKRIALEAF